MERSGNMNKLNVYIGHCDESHKCGAAHTINERGEELTVCYDCGVFVFKQRFDTLRFLTDLVHDGIDDDESIQEQLEAALSEKYDWLDWCDLEILAKMLVQNLADQARFDASAEDDDAAETDRDTRVDYREMIGMAW